MASTGALRGLLVRKLNTLLRVLEDDLKTFGRSREHVWRGIFNIMDELLLEQTDIKKFLNKLTKLIDFIFDLQEKAYYMAVLAYFYSRIGNKEKSMSLFSEAYSIADHIENKIKSAKVKSRIILKIFESKLFDFGEKLVDNLLNTLSQLPLLTQIDIISLVGFALSKYDVGRGDSLVSYARRLVQECETVDCKVKGLVKCARRLVQISDDVENIRIAKNWISEALRELENVDYDTWLAIISEIVGDVYIVNKGKAFQIVGEIIDSTRINQFGLKILIKCLRSLAKVKADDLFNRTLEITIGRINRSSKLTKAEKIFLVTKSESLNRYIDTYKADFAAKQLSKIIIREINQIKNKRKLLDLLKALRYLAELDLNESYIQFLLILNTMFRNRLAEENIVKVLRIMKKFIRVFPVALIKEIEVIYDAMKNVESPNITALLLLNEIFASINHHYYKELTRYLMKLSEKMSRKDKIVMLAKIAAILYKRDDPWAEQIIDYTMEELNALRLITRAQLLIEISEILAKKNPEKGKELLKSALKILERKSENEKTIKLLFIISRKMKNLYGDENWARQIEILAREIQRKRKKR